MTRGRATGLSAHTSVSRQRHVHPVNAVCCNLHDRGDSIRCPLTYTQPSIHLHSTHARFDQTHICDHVCMNAHPHHRPISSPSNFDAFVSSRAGMNPRRHRARTPNTEHPRPLTHTHNHAIAAESHATWTQNTCGPDQLLPTFQHVNS